MKRKILLDCDEVLLNWICAFRDYLKRDRQISCNTLSPSSWNLSEWTGLPYIETLQEIQRFNTECPEFARLKPIDGAVQAIKELKRLGYSMDIITSCSDDEACVARRNENLFQVFGDVFDKITIVPLLKSKKAVLSEYEPSFWIEDNVQNALIGRDVGHIPIVRRNVGGMSMVDEIPSDIHIADDWPGILHAISTHNMAITA